jgi:hypothetical protein
MKGPIKKKEEYQYYWTKTQITFPLYENDIIIIGVK